MRSLKRTLYEPKRIGFHPPVHQRVGIEPREPNLSEEPDNIPDTPHQARDAPEQIFQPSGNLKVGLVENPWGRALEYIQLLHL